MEAKAENLNTFFMPDYLLSFVVISLAALGWSFNIAEAKGSAEIIGAFLMKMIAVATFWFTFDKKIKRSINSIRTTSGKLYRFFFRR